MVSEIRPGASAALVCSSDADHRLAQWIATCAVRAHRCGYVCMYGVCVTCACVACICVAFVHCMCCVCMVCGTHVWFVCGVFIWCCVVCAVCVWYTCGWCVWVEIPACSSAWPTHMVLGVPGEGVLHRSEAVKGHCSLTHSISSLLFSSPECTQNFKNKCFPFCVEPTTRKMNTFRWICNYRISLWGKLEENILLRGIIRGNATQHVVCK